METALALIFVLLQVISPDTERFTMSVMPDLAFYGTKQENGIWRIETGSKDSKVFFGDAHVDGRKFIIRTKAGRIPFEAADKMGLPEKTEWKKLQTVGKAPLIYKIRRARDQVEFVPTKDDDETPSVVTKLELRKKRKQIVDSTMDPTPKDKQAEQGGASHPATASESKSEGKKKPEPEPKRRSQ